MTRAVLKNPYLVIVLALAIVVLGGYIYPKIPKDLLPIFETPAVQIVTFYPGMPPEVMEKDIMSRMQRWTGQSVGIEHQEAKAMTGVCIVKDVFREGITLDTAMAQTTSYAMSDMFYLPPGTIPPMLMPYDPTASLPLCLVVVSNPNMDEQQLYDIAYYELRNKLQSIQGVIAPAVFGGKLRRIYAYMEPTRLEAFGLTMMDIQRALAKYNVLIPAGTMKDGPREVQIFTNAIPETIEELNDTIVKVVDGVPVKISDVGIVKNTSQIQTNIVRINGSRQAYIPIYRQPGANSIEIVKTIKTNLAKILEKLKTERSSDAGIETLDLQVAMDQSIPVQESISGLQWAAGLGAVFAGVIVLFFLRSITSTLIITLAIPLAILAAIIGLFFTGDTINSMTLGGLALAIGILVDQSIVVLENIVRHVNMGKSPMQAAFDGTREVVVPIGVSTITFVVVFFPIAFLSGLSAYLFTPLAVAASIAIFASFILSITLVPAYCAKFLKGGIKPRRRGEEDEGQTNSRDGMFLAMYDRVLSVVLTLRYMIVLVAVVLFAGAAWVLAHQGRELIPPIDAGQFTVYIRMPAGDNIDTTNAKIDEIETTIMQAIGIPPNTEITDPAKQEQLAAARTGDASDLKFLVSNIGVLMDWPAAYTPNVGPSDAFMLVQLKKDASLGAFDYVVQLRKTLNKDFPNVEFAFDTGGMLTSALNYGEPSPIHFQVAGPKLETLQDIARVIRDEARNTPGTVDVRIAQRIDYPAVLVKMNRDLAARLGITPEDVMKNLVSATNSSVGFDPAFWIDKSKGNHYFIGVQFPEELLRDRDILYNIPVAIRDGIPIRLGQVAEIIEETSPGSISHRNITRVMDVYANVEQGYDVGGVMAAIEGRLNKNKQLLAVASSDNRGDLYELGVDNDPTKKHKYESYNFRAQGEVKAMREAFGQFTAGLVIATVLVYLIMVAQFRSFVDPFVIILTVPLGFIGVAAMMLLTGTNLSIMSFMGIVMMVGIVVEYSIVLVDFANKRVGEGMSIREAIVDAAKVRARPILMTSLTTWLALLPMAIGIGGGGANVPLARTIIGGVVAATVLSLIVVPCLYTILKRPPNNSPAELLPA